MFCRSIVLDHNIDLNNVCAQSGMLFERDGIGHASRGIVAEVSEDHISDVLTSIKNLTPELPDPVAFSLVPFLPNEKATFLIPQFVVSKWADNTATATLIGSTESEVSESRLSDFLSDATNTLNPSPTTNSFQVNPGTPVDDYLATVALARDTVRSGELQKVVIARDIEISASKPIDTHSILHRLRASFGSSYRYCIGNLIGASPELLVHVEGRLVQSHPLAGTAPRTGDPDTDARLADELIASTKNQVEHRLVIDMVHDTLLPHCSYLDWEAEPSIVTVANVQHLGTAIEGALTEPRPPVMTLVRLLCPTPALGGHPSNEAIAFIQNNEQFDRGHYGGAVGVLNKHGDGTFAVAIRCAKFNNDKTSARLFAGGGIVGESEPLSELAETQSKFQAMLSAIVRP
jgi:menaquinone-specific isochorismate synthase